MFDSVKISLSLTKGICHFSYFRGSLLPADSERLTRFKAALHLAVVTPPPHPLALIPDARGLLHSERTARFPVPGGRVSPPRAPYCPCQPSLVEAQIPVGARTARAGTPRMNPAHLGLQHLGSGAALPVRVQSPGSACSVTCRGDSLGKKVRKWHNGYFGRILAAL